MSCTLDSGGYAHRIKSRNSESALDLFEGRVLPGTYWEESEVVSVATRDDMASWNTCSDDGICTMEEVPGGPCSYDEAFVTA